MRRSYIVIGILVLIVVLAFSGYTGLYNSLVGKFQGIDGQWAQVETQYQRRFDLIPNLVSSVKGGMAQEQDVFIAIAEARTRYAGARTVDERAAAAGQVETSLARLLVVMENYPQLRSLENVRQLMDELAGTENRIAVERRRFNDLVRDYNTTIKQFPNYLLAGAMGFNELKYFESVAGAGQAPQVEF